MSAKVVTFYSFKGGVGRTQALANVAVALARQGKRVIAVDMDMESPGLHAFFGPERSRTWNRAELATHEGLIDFLERAAKVPDEEPRVTDLLLPCAHSLLDGASGSVQLLLPGRLDERYPQRVAGFSWDGFYAQNPGYQLMELVRAQLTAAADCVLVDSRTGMTDVAGICTFQLPDMVIALFALHHQGIEGVRQVAETIARTRDGDGERLQHLLLVPARVDEYGARDRRDRWLQTAEISLRDVPGVLLLTGSMDRIPYDAGVAYGEEIVVGGDSYLANAYRRLAQRILSITTSEELQEETPAHGPALTRDAAHRLARHVEAAMVSAERQVGAELEMIRRELAPRLDDAGLELPPALRQSPSTLDDLRALGSTAVTLVDQAWAGWRERWLAEFRRELAAAAEDDVSPFAEDLLALGQDLEQGDLDTARRRLDECCERARQSSADALLRKNQLDPTRLARSRADRGERAQWLVSRLERAMDEQSPTQPEEALPIIRNCLRLLVHEGENDATLWPAYEALCGFAGDASHDDATAIGLPLWRGAWGRYFGSDDKAPPAPDDALPVGAKMREQLTNLAAVHYEPLVNDIRAGLEQVASRWPSGTLDSLCRLRHDDPALAAALGRLGTSMSPAMRRMMLALALAHGMASEAIVAGYIDALLAEQLVAEAFFTHEALARRHGTLAATTGGRACARFLGLAIERGATTVVEELINTPRWRAMIESSPAGRAHLVMLAGQLGAEQPVGSGSRMALLSHLLHETSIADLPAPVQDWLRHLEQHRDIDLAVAAEISRRVTELRRKIAGFPAHNQWPPSKVLAGEFETHWEQFIAALLSGSDGETTRKSFDEWLHDARRKAENQGFKKPDPVGTLRRTMQDVFDEVYAQAEILARMRAEQPVSLAELVDIHDKHGVAREALQQWPQRLDERASELAALSEPSANEPLTPGFAAHLFQLSTRLVRFSGPEPWERFISDMLDWSTGERTHRGVAEELIAEQRWWDAFMEIETLEPAARVELEQRIVTSVDELVTELEHRSHIVGEAVDELERAGTGGSEYLAEARRCVNAGAGELARLGRERVSTSVLECLRTRNQIWLDTLKKSLDEARELLDLARDDLREQADKARKELFTLKKKINEIRDELLFAGAKLEQMSQLREAADHALATRNLDQMQLVHDLARRLADGEDIAGESSAFEPPAPARSPAAQQVQEAQQAAIPPAQQAARLRRPPLSAIARRGLTGSAHGTPYRFEPSFLPTSEWSKRALQRTIDSIRATLTGLDEAAMRDRDELGVYLVEQGKLHLLAGELFSARVVFADALRWLASRPELSPEWLARASRWLNACAWGFSLAFLLPHLRPDEQQRILAPENLRALFDLPSGELLLAVLEKHSLVDTYGWHVLALGSPAGEELVRSWLKPYLDEHPLAEQELAAGLFLRESEEVHALGKLVATLLASRVKDAGAAMHKLIAESDSLEDSRGRARYFRDQLRAWLAAHEGDADLIAAMQQAIRRLDAAAEDVEEEGALLSWSVLTKDVEVEHKRTSRIIVSITGKPGLTTRFAVRADAQLLADQGQLIPGALGVPALIDRIAARDRRELVIPIACPVDDAVRGAYVQVSFRVPDEHGTWNTLDAGAARYPIRIVPAASRTDKPASPYVVGVAVQDRAGIYGRELKLDQIFQALQGQRQDNTVLVLGDRRIGKTTLLNAVLADPRRHERYPLAVLVDQQHVQDLDVAVFRRIIENVQQELRRHAAPTHDEIRRQLPNDPGEYFRRFLGVVDRDLERRDKRMLLILDELEKLYQLDTTARRPVVLQSVRAAIMQCRRISFILSGVNDVVGRYVGSHEDRLFQLGLPVELDALAESAAMALIEQPVARHYEMSRRAVRLVVEQTGGHPYLLQRIGHSLFWHMIERRAVLATVTDVEEVLEQTILPDASAFDYLIKAWRDKQIFTLLKALAHQQSSTRYVSVAEIHRWAARDGLTMSSETVTDWLAKLSNEVRTVIERSPSSKVRFRLKVPLLARHIQWRDRSANNLVLRHG